MLLYSLYGITLRCVIPVVCVTKEREESVVNTSSLERCCILIMKLHVSACNGHHQASTPIKKNIYIYKLFLIYIQRVPKMYTRFKRCYLCKMYIYILVPSVHIYIYRLFLIIVET